MYTRIPNSTNKGKDFLLTAAALWIPPVPPPANKECLYEPFQLAIGDLFNVYKFYGKQSDSNNLTQTEIVILLIWQIADRYSQLNLST